MTVFVIKWKQSDIIKKFATVINDFYHDIELMGAHLFLLLN